MKITAIVLAAGPGTRMRSDLPKVVHPVAGRPMVRYVVDAARALQPETTVVVVGYGADLVRQAVGDGVVYVAQPQWLGTADAVRQAEEAAGRGGTVLVLYGDTPLIRAETLASAVAHHEAEGAAVTLLTSRPEDPADYGRVVRDPDRGEARAAIEQAESTPAERRIAKVGSGILSFRGAWLWPALRRLRPRAGGELCLTDLVAVARQEGERVSALSAPDPLECLSVDDRVTLARAETGMRRRINERWMLAGVTLVHPETTYIEAGVEIGADTVVYPNSSLQGTTRIGRGCTIGPGAVIRDSAIGDRCRVELSVLEEAVMEQDSDIGPFSHLRRGARVGAGAHVGNFGEIKNSTLGPGAKMGHFSYLGDATVGANANIGAGTITCNFDGQRKHRTVIGEGAFIGSDTMLVAPVEVGEGAKTGAGAVVTHDLPAHSVAIGVPARVRTAAGGTAEEEDGRDSG